MVGFSPEELITNLLAGLTPEEQTQLPTEFQGQTPEEITHTILTEGTQIHQPALVEFIGTGQQLGENILNLPQDMFAKITGFDIDFLKDPKVLIILAVVGIVILLVVLK